MEILRINSCRFCGRRAELTERNGGWSVDCYFSHPLHALDDNQDWCNAWEETLSSLYPTPNDAIENWNKENFRLKVIICNNHQTYKQYLKDNGISHRQAKFVNSLDSLRGLRNVDIIYGYGWLDSPLFNSETSLAEVQNYLKIISRKIDNMED